MKENSIEETKKQLELILKVRKEQKEIIECAGGSCINCNPDIKALSESIDILSDYKRVLKENEQLSTEVNSLKKENEEKDKIIDLLIKELYTKAHISTRCYLQTSTEECMKYKNCYECLKKHFENKERRNNGKGN